MKKSVCKNLYERMLRNLFIRNKKGIEMEMLAWWIIALAVLVIMFLAYMILRGRGIGAIEYIQNLFRFGR